MESRSLKLALEYVKDAQKASKSSWFSKPEWDIAAKRWDDAASSYKTAQHYEESIDCYTKASEAYVSANSIYLAAKCIENAAVLAEKQLRNPANAIKYYCRASDLYRSQGSSPDRAASMMEKAAKICESVDINQAIQLYDNALNIYETEDRARFSMDTFKRVTKLMVDNGRFMESVEIQSRLVAVCEQINNRSELNKSRLCVIILLLAFGDSIEAGKKLDEFGQDVSFARSNEAGVADFMIQAYKNGDQEMFSDLAGDQTLSFIESSVARLAARIRVPGAKRAAPEASVPPASETASAGIPNNPHAPDYAPLQQPPAAGNGNVEDDEDDDLL
ncbi:hypothetical protein GGI07_004757 [Coemansia sp. Benny D115]|nr:hypothetical protein GGI07_004757 [Coemansia sp. Benny D115]